MPRQLLFALLLLLVAAPALAGDAPDLAAAAKAAGTVNGLCPVKMEPVTREAGRAEYRGEQIGFCSAECKAAFAIDPVRYMDRMRVNPAKFAYTSVGPTRDEMAKAAAAVGSANGLCPVMKRLVTPAGGSADYKGQKIAFCCPPCRAKFAADPERYMRDLRADPMAYGYARPGPTHAELRAARENAGVVNGLCPVMLRLVEPGGGYAVYEGEKIGFCCPPCRAKFLADPAGHLAKMREEPAVYGYLPAK